VRARLGRWATVEAVDPGSCRVRMDADALEWPAMALGSTGAAFTVLGPPEFAAHLRALAERYAAAVAGSSTRP
jgi:predicted DNA-binding transcriptional regulator YafY